MDEIFARKEDFYERNHIGFPKKVIRCKSCLLTNQKMVNSDQYLDNTNTKKETIKFYDGICSACLVNKLKKKIDYKDREKQLEEILSKYRSKNGDYDVLIPGSGGKDSFYASHVLKYKYGMNPLTVTWRPHIYTEWGQHNFESWINTGVANILYSPNPHIHRLLSRLALENLFHPFQTFGLGQQNLPAKIAKKFNIKLIFYGEDSAEYGSDAKNYFSYKGLGASNVKEAIDEIDESKIFLGGITIEELRERFDLKINQLDPYLPILSEELENSKIMICKLGYFLKWRPQSNYYYASENSDFMPAPERTQGTYTKFNSIDDKLDDLFYWTGFIKSGLGRTTFDASQDIWNNEISRNEGLSLISKYEGEYPDRFEKEVFEYLSMNMESIKGLDYFKQKDLNRNYLFKLADNFRQNHIWHKNSSGKWEISYSHNNVNNIEVSDWG